ncbi:MAG TPA: SDR family NAD(P)-dependent oxidoreductase [Croceibacterium sp.]|nr:SDR family NAD(P)-dependent oxidoreductase [Croceibacterium sp.]
MKDFAGRTAFVTGGANGVGIGIVRNLLGEGCKVAIADIRQDSIDAALAGVDTRAVMGVQLNVMDRAGFAAAADQVEAELGPVSLLFNNAGINLFQTIEDSSYDDWDWVLGVNLGGVINGVMTFAPRMKARARSGEVTGGHITNTASMASFIASGAPGIYNTAKFAVRGLSYSLRHSMYPYGIGVSVVHPGLVKSLIYASDAVRPDALKRAMQPVDPAAVERLAGIHQFGMEPDTIGARILDGIRENRANIFTHPDHKDELREIFDEILADYRDYPEDAGFERRVAFEQARREKFAETRRQAQAVG